MEKQPFSNEKAPVKIIIPEKGIESELLLLCKKNYEYYKNRVQGSVREAQGKCI
jgi:hypothetical protein